jgi:NAD+ kinase
MVIDVSDDIRKIERVLLFRGSSTPDCQAAAERLVGDLRAGGFNVSQDLEQFHPERVDLVLLLGGDGFLMDSLRALNYPPTPIFGINFGSVGFLMNKRASMEGLVPALKEGRLRFESHTVLEGRVRTTRGQEEVWLAINDLVLERMGGQSVRLRVIVDTVLLNEFSGDGIIISTSAGSTAYNLAAGGPVFHPSIQAIALTPLYPHRASPFNSLQFSVLLPLSSSLQVTGLDIEKRPIRLLADGRPLEGVSEVTVRDSGRRMRLLRTESHQFVSTLARKFIGPPEASV